MHEVDCVGGGMTLRVKYNYLSRLLVLMISQQIRSLVFLWTSLSLSVLMALLQQTRTGELYADRLYSSATEGLVGLEFGKSNPRILQATNCSDYEVTNPYNCGVDINPTQGTSLLTEFLIKPISCQSVDEIASYEVLINLKASLTNSTQDYTLYSEAKKGPNPEFSVFMTSTDKATVAIQVTNKLNCKIRFHKDISITPLDPSQAPTVLQPLEDFISTFSKEKISEAPYEWARELADYTSRYYPTIEPACPSCSQRGDCENITAYNEERCVCLDTFMGPSCNVPVQVSNLLNSVKRNLIRHFNSTLYLKDLVAKDYRDTFKYIASLIDDASNYDSETLAVALDVTSSFINYSIPNQAYKKLDVRTFNNMLRVADVTLHNIWDRDCNVTQADVYYLYRSATNVVKRLASLTIDWNAFLELEETILQANNIKIHAKRYLVKSLNETMIEPRFDIPNFQVTFSPKAELNGYTDLQMILFEKNYFKCPNDTNPNSTTTVAFDLYKVSTQITQEASPFANVTLFFPLGDGSTCNDGFIAGKDNMFFTECRAEILDWVGIKNLTSKLPDPTLVVDDGNAGKFSLIMSWVFYFCFLLGTVYILSIVELTYRESNNKKNKKNKRKESVFSRFKDNTKILVVSHFQQAG